MSFRSEDSSTPAVIKVEANVARSKRILRITTPVMAICWAFVAYLVITSFRLGLPLAILLALMLPVFPAAFLSVRRSQYIDNFASTLSPSPGSMVLPLGNQAVASRIITHGWIGKGYHSRTKVEPNVQAGSVPVQDIPLDTSQ
jgi:hypothetical protein